jgi:Ca-activated chloride channel family protein
MKTIVLTISIIFNTFTIQASFLDKIFPNYYDIYQYNKGTEALKNNDYQQAAEDFQKALTENNCSIKNSKDCAKLYYNHGNTLYRLGEQINTDQSDEKLEIKKNYWQNSINQYKKALEYNENDKKTEENLEFVKQKLKELEKKEKQKKEDEQGSNNNKNQDNKQQNDQNKNSEKNNQSKEGDKEKSEKDKDGQNQSEQKDRENNEQNSKSKSDEGAASKEDSQSQQRENNLSQQEDQQIEQYMQRLEEEEKQLNEYFNQNGQEKERSNNLPNDIFNQFFNDPFFDQYFELNPQYKEEGSKNEKDW